MKKINPVAKNLRLKKHGIEKSHGKNHQEPLDNEPCGYCGSVLGSIFICGSEQCVECHNVLVTCCETNI